MSARAIEVFPAVTVATVDDKSAVLLKTGAAALGMSIAEARFVAQKLARAADEVEYQLAQRKRVYARISEDECDAAFDPELQMGANDDRR